MPFFMNVFNQEFRGSLVLSDRQYSIDFVVPANKNSSEWTIAWNNEPYDLSTYTNLVFYVGVNNIWAKKTVSVSGGATDSAKTVATRLNAIAAFSQYFTADVTGAIGSQRLRFKAVNPRVDTKYFVSNESSELIFRFNKYAGIAELPTYFNRNILTFDPSTNPELQLLIALDGTDTAADGDRAIIRNFLDNQSWSNSDLKADYELLEGRSGLFKFKVTTLDGSNRPSVIIEYSAGAAVGDLAKRITYTYDGSTTTVINYTEEPYTLTSGDIITPV